MDTCVITLTAPQRRALLAFLKRARLTGDEAPAFLEIFNLIHTAKPEPAPALTIHPKT